MKTKILGLLAVGLVVGPTAANAMYWSLFNAEGESAASAVYVTYATLGDMLSDTNRVGTFLPNGFGAGRNVVGSGSNGTTYWSLFNAEGESAASAVYVTYATFSDMLSDTNRVGTFLPNGFGAGRNVVGSGSDEFFKPETPVSEPGSLALFGLGLAGLGLSRRRKAN